MSALSAVLLLLASLACAQPKIDADAGPDVKPAKPARVSPPAVNCPDLTQAPASGVFCGSIQACERYCPCACTLTKLEEKQWSYGVADDNATSCPNMAKTGPGMPGPKDPSLLPLQEKFGFIEYPGVPLITQPVLEGLRRLDGVLGQLEATRPRGVKARILNCYREAYKDSVRECGFVLMAMVSLKENAGDKTQESRWRWLENPMNLGLTWPGRSPHSEGYACDIILVDRKGQECFNIATRNKQTCEFPEKESAELLNKAVDEAGGRRLTYELCHFQWGSDVGTCKYPNCPWPVAGHP